MLSLRFQRMSLPIKGRKKDKEPEDKLSWYGRRESQMLQILPWDLIVTSVHTRQSNISAVQVPVNKELDECDLWQVYCCRACLKSKPLDKVSDKLSISPTNTQAMALIYLTSPSPPDLVSFLYFDLKQMVAEQLQGITQCRETERGSSNTEKNIKTCINHSSSLFRSAARRWFLGMHVWLSSSVFLCWWPLSNCWCCGSSVRR